MTKSEIFAKAHKVTKATVQAGDDYRVTFGAALKMVISESKEGGEMYVMSYDKGALSITNIEAARTTGGEVAKNVGFIAIIEKSVEKNSHLRFGRIFTAAVRDCSEWVSANVQVCGCDNDSVIAEMMSEIKYAAVSCIIE